MGRDLYVCTAGDLATRSVASRPPDATVAETTTWLESEGFDVVPVIDGETVVGDKYFNMIDEARNQTNDIPSTSSGKRELWQNHVQQVRSYWE
jgi:predicted transcriptional regulator